MDISTAVVGGIWAMWAAYSSPIKEMLIKRLGDKATNVAKQFTEAAWDRVNWNLSSRKYQNAIQELYGTVRMFGKSEPVSLEGIFTDVVILEKPTAFHRYDIKLLRQEPEQLELNKSRKAGLALVKAAEHKRIFLVGKPGAGKTTFLKYLTLQAAKGGLDKIPIFVSLKEWSDSNLKLMEYLARQFEICDFPNARAFVHHILRKGDALVLFDGLDEVENSDRIVYSTMKD
ncbi:MAG: NACHT domain-containing protein [Pyrinomonadaceae bacterium]